MINTSSSCEHFHINNTGINHILRGDNLPSLLPNMPSQTDLNTSYPTFYITKFKHWIQTGHRGRRNLRQVGGFLWVLRFPLPLKLTATI